MILTAFHIANFKAFATTQRIPLRPITLVYGANSAGKSSVLHALALAHHAIETGDFDTQQTRIGGETIDLGGFRQYVHRRERDRRVDLGFEVDSGRLSGRLGELVRSSRQIGVEIEIRKFDGKDGIGVGRFGLEADGTQLLTMSARPGGRMGLNLHHGHPVFREFCRAILLFATTTQEIHEDDFGPLGEAVDALVPGLTGKTTGLFPRIEEEAEEAEEGREGWGSLLPVSRGQRREDLATAVQLFLPKALRDLVGGIGEALESEVRRLRYLGPLRSYPPRHLAFSQHHDPNWFAGGGYAWDVVGTNVDVRQRVNRWLGDGDRLKTPYQLEVRDLLPASAVARELPAKLHRALYDLAASFLQRREGEGEAELGRLADEVSEQVAEYGAGETEGIIAEIEEFVAATSDEEAVAERWATELVEARPEALQDLVLIDKRTGTPLSHRDVGIGISQVLPVLVLAYASREKLLAIEQPEIHLHPALQAELGDVFLESALGGGRNTYLIETHSEHLLLRTMRRIRETAEGQLPEGVPEVRPEDVMVLFVEPDGPQSIVREMPLNERGELVKAWPGGFFEEGLREIF